MDAFHPGSPRRPVRRFGGPAALGLCLIVLCATGWYRAAAAAPDDNTAALAALTDTRAAIKEILHASDNVVNSPGHYLTAAQRAINALVGSHDSRFQAASGNPGDALGAIGHIDRLLDRTATPRWVAPLHGAEANLRAAVARLQDALQAHELGDYQFKVTDALLDLEMAVGRPTDVGVLGGLTGALATTTLGIPAGARQVSACKPVAQAPAYGVADGYLAYVTVPAKSGTAVLPEDFGSRRITVAGSDLVIHTAAAKRVAKLCQKQASSAGGTKSKPSSTSSADNGGAGRQTAASAPSGSAVTAAETAATSSSQQPVAKADAAAPGAKPSGGGSAGVPRLYTKAQARVGKKVFFGHCVSCHGKTLQGVAAPSVAGDDFLQAAEHNGWTLEVIRYLVFNNMPFNAPGELSPKQYSDVLAFLLASNCFPSGNKPFPQHDEDRFNKIQLKPVSGAHPDHPKIGTCDVN